MSLSIVGSINFILLERLDLWSPKVAKWVPLKSDIPSRNCGDFSHRPQPFRCHTAWPKALMEKCRKLHLLAEHFWESDVGEDRLTHGPVVVTKLFSRKSSSLILKSLSHTSSFCRASNFHNLTKPFMYAIIGENTTLVRKKNSNTVSVK